MTISLILSTTIRPQSTPFAVKFAFIIIHYHRYRPHIKDIGYFKIYVLIYAYLLF